MTPIPGFEDYFVTHAGKVFSTKRKGMLLELKQSINKGYAYVYLCVNGKHHTLKVHRIVAITFIPNPENKKEVNHKDANKLNNSVDNLEWATRSENSKHAHQMGLVPLTEKRINASLNNLKKIIKGSNGKKVRNTMTGEIYISMSEAARRINVPEWAIIEFFSGRNKRVYPLERVLS